MTRPPGFRWFRAFLRKRAHQDMIWVLSVAWITGGQVWKLEDDCPELAFPDGVGEPCGIHARFDAASEFQKLACIVVGGVRQVFLCLVHCRQDRGGWNARLARHRQGKAQIALTDEQNTSHPHAGGEVEFRRHFGQLLCRQCGIPERLMNGVLQRCAAKFLHGGPQPGIAKPRQADVSWLILG